MHKQWDIVISPQPADFESSLSAELASAALEVAWQLQLARVQASSSDVLQLDTSWGSLQDKGGLEGGWAFQQQQPWVNEQDTEEYSKLVVVLVVAAESEDTQNRGSLQFWSLCCQDGDGWTAQLCFHRPQLVCSQQESLLLASLAGHLLGRTEERVVAETR